MTLQDFKDELLSRTSIVFLRVPLTEKHTRTSVVVAVKIQRNTLKQITNAKIYVGEEAELQHDW